MTWQKEVDELKHRQKKAMEMGGPEAVAKHKAEGKYTVRERIDKFIDKNTFHEIGSLVGRVKYDDAGNVNSLTPAANIVGYGNVNGRPVSIQCGDHTVRGDVAGHKRDFAAMMAMEWHMPYVRLVEEPGGSVRGIESQIKPAARIHVPTNSLNNSMKLMEVVPVVSGAMGSVAGYAAIWMTESHWSIMTKNTSEIFVAGPPVVSRALGIDMTKQELGGYKVHAYKSGVVDNVAENDYDLINQIKLFLSYMPQSVWDQPVRSEPVDDPNRREEELISVLPRDKRKMYSIRKLISLIMDKDSIFELCPYYGKSFVVMLAKLDGYPVMIFSNDCKYYGGAQTSAACEKMERFVDLADSFHLPVIYLVDVPGFMVGPEAELEGIERKSARAHFAVAQATVPWISVLLRRRFGVAGGIHGSKARLNFTYAWPSANVAAMPLEGGVKAVYKSEIESAPDPAAKQAEIEQRLERLNSAFRTGESMMYDEMIDPRDTRPLLCEFVREAYKVTKTQLGPKYRSIRP